MTKDGTGRGGARIGAGRKPKPLEEKILEGRLPAADFLIPDQTDFKIPAPKKYLLAEQKGGEKTYAKQVHRETYNWLKNCGCAELIPSQLVENFSQTTARHIQAEELITQTGFLSRHPTTGEPMPSPFVKISLDYLKAANQLFYQIFQIVKENSTTAGSGTATDTMELILRRTRQEKLK